jgi:uncharacterized protein DUF1592/uncharacterized protein DUF1588/uncharacterized protein DUF1595
MTGVSTAPRGSSSPRPLRRSNACLGVSVIIAALAGTACQSELADGKPGDNGVELFNPDGTPINNGQPGPNGVVNPNVEGNPTPDGNVMNSQANRNPNIGGAGPATGLFDSSGNPLPVDQLPTLAQCETPGPQIIRRLTSAQYHNTLVRVFGEGVPDSNPLRDPTTLGYNVDADDSQVAGPDAQAINSLSEDVAQFAKDNNLIAQFANNCMDLNNNDCRQTFVKNLGQALSREPLDQGRVDRFAALFTEQVDGTPLATTFEDGAMMVISAMIQSPYMIYRREIGQQQNGAYQLSSYEVASELSYMLTNNPPDQELMAAAANNQLGSTDQILSQAQRLLATGDAEGVLEGFVTAWLDLDRLKGKAKAGEELTDTLRESMLEESRELFLDVFRNDGTIGDLFSANYTFMNGELSSFYGVGGVSGDQFQEVDISGGQRVPGLLGHGSYLTAHALADNSSPVQRAFVVRERILCNDLPPVPTNLDTNLKPQAPTATSRDRYKAHSENAVCYNCHQLMDPIGFSFEGYDTFGRPRTTEAGSPIDTSGTLALMDDTGLTAMKVPLTSVVDLTMHISQSEQARACLINNLSYYAYGIANDNKWASADKTCTDNFIRQTARTSGNTLKSVLTGILSAPHFTRRVQAKG